MSALRHYRDDGPLVELASRAAPAASAPASSALAWTLTALLPLLTLLVVPREHAPVALCLAGLLAAALNGRAFASPHAGRLDWLVPPVLRGAEYAALLRLAALDGASTVPACYALLAALAYHHYDLVYRLRDRGETPGTTMRRIGLGWEGRLLAAGLLAQLDVLRPVMYVAAAVLLVTYVVEGTLAWRRGEQVTA